MSKVSHNTFECGHATCPVGRRTFLTQSAALAAAAALAACGGGADVTAPMLPSTGITINVADHSTLSAVGGVAIISIGNAPLAIVRTDAMSYLALSRVCPHRGAVVNQSGSGFQCPQHGAQFTLTGQWKGGERTSALHAYTTAYDAAAGTLTIT